MTKGKIIVVDDEENIRGTLKEILSDEGYDVFCAADGETALREIKTGAPDVVLLDVWIPGIDGMQTLKMLKSIDPDTEVVMMSGHGNIDTAVKATKLGAYDFIEKPFSLDSILRTVAKALKKRRSRLSQKQTGATGAETQNAERRFMGSSQAATQARKLIRQAAKSDDPILITGEPGLGKKFAAKVIHNLSERRNKPFVELSCAALTGEDLESALLGDTNPDQNIQKQGFGPANDGAVFFDRLDRLSAKLQKKLLDILKSGHFKTRKKRQTDAFCARVIASVAVEQNGDEEGAGLIPDLEKFFGRNVLKLEPLRNRKKDIPEFVQQFVDDLCDEHGKDIESVNKQALQILAQAPWPENIRQLKQVIEHAVLACEGPHLLKKHLPLSELDMPRDKSGAPMRDAKHPAKPDDLPQDPGGGATKKRRKIKGLKQKTLKNSVVMVGQGLHSGIKTGMILSPLPPNSGIVFGDISTGDRVPALLEYVRSTEYATTLSNGRVTIKTIEHIMSALHSYGVTNLLIKIGDEAPIMDGSAIDFCQIIENSGVKEQVDFIDEIVIDKKLAVGEQGKGPYLSVEPSDHFSIHYFMDYPPPIGRQEYKYVYKSGQHYKETIAPARTFGFLDDIRALEEAGLASGGKLSNVVLIDDEKVVNTPLRFPNEPARHKILDLIGDLFLMGRPIRGHFTAIKSGHTQNIKLTQKILDHTEACAAGKNALS